MNNPDELRSTLQVFFDVAVVLALIVWAVYVHNRCNELEDNIEQLRKCCPNSHNVHREIDEVDTRLSKQIADLRNNYVPKWKPIMGHITDTGSSQQKAPGDD